MCCGRRFYSKFAGEGVGKPVLGGGSFEPTPLRVALEGLEPYRVVTKTLGDAREAAASGGAASSWSSGATAR